jgi:NADH dehydrogenase, FAD-containing subunit
MNDSNLNSINGADGQEAKRPRVVIVGGGFGGLLRPKRLGKRRSKSFSSIERTILFLRRFFIR